MNSFGLLLYPQCKAEEDVNSYFFFFFFTIAEIKFPNHSILTFCHNPQQNSQNHAPGEAKHLLHAAFKLKKHFKLWHQMPNAAFLL